MYKAEKNVRVEKIWLTNKDAQEYLSVSVDFMKKLRRNGKLSFYKLGGMVFYLKKDIDRLIQKNRVI